MKQLPDSQSGQMTVELAVALPVLVIVAVIAFNALQFFAVCAQFDRVAHDAVRVWAASPAAGQGVDQACASAAQEAAGMFGDAPNIEVRIEHGNAGLGFDEFVATVEYYPTLFGTGLRSEVLGVPLPHLTHSSRYVVDVYKPGVVA